MTYKLRIDGIDEVTTDNGVVIEDVIVKDDEITFGSNSLGVKAAFEVMREPTGFANTVDQICSFVNGTRTFSIGPSGGGGSNYKIFVGGVVYLKNSVETLVISDVTGMHMIYFNGSGSLVEAVNPSLSERSVILRGSVMVSYIYWDTSIGEEIYFTGNNEFHGCVMDNVTSEYLHTVHGARFADGMSIEITLFDAASDGALGNWRRN